MKKKAIILLSGGLDSATTLAIAKNKGFECLPLSFNYGQKNKSENSAAIKICQSMKIPKPLMLNIELDKIGDSALTDEQIKVQDYDKNKIEIPNTYVPARNTIFLSYGLAYAEAQKASDIFIGVNAIDYAGYPDCREEYIKQYEKMANLATVVAIGGNKIKVHTPLIHLNKQQIIKIGIKFGVDYSLTVSCYNADKAGRACNRCDACFYRKKGFAQAKIADPTIYFD
jgi:7-cyano-7-deazaguanine synthase